LDSALAYKRHHQSRLRRNGDTETRNADCVEDKCKNKIVQMIIHGQKYVSGGNIELSDEMMTEMCNDRDEIKQCIADNCPVSSTFQAFIDIFGTFGWLCDSQREAVVEHGACLITAMKSGKEELKTCIQNELFVQYLQAHGGGHHGSGHRRAVSDEGKVSTLFAKIKKAAETFPEGIECQHLTTARDCIVARAKSECDKDGGTEASDFIKAGYEEASRRLFKAVKALNPSRSLFKVDKCLADGTEEPMSFFWFF